MPPTNAWAAATAPPTLVASLRAARRIAVLTGAGMSADSGVPTFRDALTGLWSRFDPHTLATRDGFVRDPALVWGWYEARRRGVLGATPNAGHRALRALAALPWVEDFSIVTQNVDDLHERAGSSQVVHLHGSLFAPRCLDCGQAARHGPPGAPTGNVDGPEPPPACGRCGGLIRPGVVWFGEALPPQAWDEAVARVRAADLLLVVGTSGRVYPAASLPDMAEDRGCPVWTIDPDEDLAAPGRNLWRATAAAALTRLVQALSGDPA